jgi:hypothetical protein
MADAGEEEEIGEASDVMMTEMEIETTTAPVAEVRALAPYH